MPVRAGIFDSGVGGLTVADALHRLAPALPISYLADTAFFPYGNRSAEEVSDRAVVLARMLVDGGATVIVVACNTASSAALERLRAEFTVPVVGMEPPVKPAVERSRSRTVAVLATTGTVSGARLARLTERHSGDATVTTIAMPGLADLVEAGEIASERVRGMLSDALRGPVAGGVDEVALGCTHYGFLRPALVSLLPAGVEVIDAAEPVARRVLAVMAESGQHVPSGPAQEVLCYATGDADSFEATIRRLRDAGAALPPLRVLRPVA
ncbi:MAG: glutamate racemase [Dehalococcoidia bacterium]|nr:MAG: glutamate racemase [Dehalococcoidia bacterium]